MTKGLGSHHDNQLIAPSSVIWLCVVLQQQRYNGFMPLLTHCIQKQVFSCIYSDLDPWFRHKHLVFKLPFWKGRPRSNNEGSCMETVPSVSVRKQSCTAAKSGVDCIAPTFHKKCRHLGTDDSYANTRFNFVSSALIWVFLQAITWERMATLESTFLEVLTKDRNGATHSHSQNRSPNFDSLQRPRSMVDICPGLTWLRMLRDDLQHESGSLKAPDRLEHHGITYGTKKWIT